MRSIGVSEDRLLNAAIESSIDNDTLPSITALFDVGIGWRVDSSIRRI